MNKNTYEEVKRFIEYETGCQLISEGYLNATIKLNIKCKCGNNYYCSLENFRRYEYKRKCPDCNNKIKLYYSHREFIKKLYNKYNCSYSVLELYKGCKKKLLIKHNTCGHKWKVTPDVLLNEDYKGCPNCSAKNAKKKNSVDFTYVKNFIEKEGYSLLSTQYKNAKSVLKLQCPNNHIYEVDWNHFKNVGNRCSKCRYNHKKEYEDIKTFIENEGYKLIDEKYINSNCKLHLVCPNNHDYYVTWNDFHSSGNRCPKCKNSSKGERKIFLILTKNSMNFTQQYKIKKCRYIRPLPFDFALFDKENRLILLIEYDGIQHFEIKKAFGGEKGFHRTVKNDKIKNEFCKRENINLLRIPYWEFDNIEKILINELNKRNIQWGNQKVV